ncbi:hypothetical protein [Rhodoluna limnophila]|uniref:hypothetical protein n=1 Tax=Rhodoluna limnophila TaxID=232537 RepID=UPI001107539B|nr:hypothetical protein [Rhodoluna limnophila]
MIAKSSLSLALILLFSSLCSPATASDLSIIDAEILSESVPQDLDYLSHSEGFPAATGVENVKLGESGAGQVAATITMLDTEGHETEFSMAPVGLGKSFAEGQGIATSTDLGGGVTHVAESEGSTFRFLAESDSIASARSINYEISLPKNTYLLELVTGEYQILDPLGEYFGTLSKPWAIDANGVRYESRFDMKNGTLTQINQIPQSAAAPILTDPSWSYQMDFSQHIESDGSTGIPPTIYYSKRSPLYVTSLLKKCFNCYFPVSGAPPTYPYVGQVMPLYVLNPVLFGLVTYNMKVKVTRTFNYGWEFAAMSGHVDGIGSTIKFLWYPDAYERLHLKVSAYIVEENPIDMPFTSLEFDQNLYRNEARATWQSFFNAVT